ncbi:hypothetical protein N7470_002552 [Penicillium chermesinum]|nr:hypothetical protein N7470_002552 [Penicillium chermesinum]
MPSSKQGRSGKKRTKPRQLVRWDSDHDIMLLLTIQQQCNSQGIKLPWADIASTMGEKFSEGAIVQHLSKVRSRRENEGKRVPPPLRRSAGGSSGAGASATIQAASSRKDTRRKPGSGRAKKRKALTDSEDDDGETISSTDKSDGEDPSYGSRKKQKHKKKPNKAFTGTKGRHSSVKHGRADTEGSSDGDEEKSSTETSEAESSDDEDDKDNEPRKRSKIVRLPVSPTALDRLEQTGMVQEQDSSDTIFRSSPAPHWPLNSPSQHFAATYPPPYGPIAGTQHGAFTMPYQQGIHSGPTPWPVGSNYPLPYPAPPMPQGGHDWDIDQPQDPLWDSPKSEVDEA